MKGSPALFLVACWAVLFAPFLLQGRVFVPGDFLGFIYPWRELGLPFPHNLELFDVMVFFYPQDVFVNACLKAGDFPLWNPHIFCGHPMVGSGQSALLYPPRLLAQWLFSPAVARTLNIAGHSLLDGLLMYLWLRGRRLLPWAACVGGLVWMFNGQVAGWLEFEHTPVLAAWLPLMLWCLDRALEGRRRYWGLLALVGGLSLHGGHLQYSLYCGLVVGIYALVRVRTWKRWAALLGTTVLILMLAAPTLLPFLELLRQSQRAVFTPQEIRATMAPSLGTLLGTLVCPDLWGNPARGFMLNRVRANLIYPEFACFLGLLPLGLALLAVVRRQEVWPRREVWAWAALGVVSPLLAAATPLYDLVLLLLPPLKILVPARILLSFHFAGAALAALGAHLWLTQGPPKHLRVVTLVLLLAWGATLSWLHWWLETAPAQVLALPIKIPPLDSPPEAVLAAARANYSSPQMLAPFVILGGLMLWGGRGRGWLLAGLAAVDLLLFAVSFNTTVAPATLFPATPQTSYLREHAGLYRVDKRHAAFYNTLVPYGVHLLSGYESMFPKRVFQTLSAGEPGAPSMRSLSLQNFQPRFLEAFALRYLVLPPQEAGPGAPWEPLGGGLYENKKALERAFVCGGCRVFGSLDEVRQALASPDFSPRETVCLEEQPGGPVEAAAAGSPVTIREHGPDRVVLEVEMKASGLVVLSDTFYPGWEARVDGERRPILAANGCSRAVQVNPGAHRVEFDYRPASLGYGLGACALALGVLCVFWTLTGRECHP